MTYPELADEPLHRLLLLVKPAGDIDELNAQLACLREMLFRALQEIEVLRALLLESGDGRQGTYRELLVRRMIGDHDSAGVDPHRRHSYFRHLLKERDFLQQVLGMSDEELLAFEREVEEVSIAT
ncbi:MAG TPA: hypothetical protein VMT85_09765 [Thermoanaerobaculia bacterium]|nr:hypothetical protein [Thermoanaerobaculia bacterium]